MVFRHSRCPRRRVYPMQKKEAASSTAHTGPEMARNTTSFRTSSDQTPAQRTHSSRERVPEGKRLL